MPLEDLEKASHLLVNALQIRQRYMKMSHQSLSGTATTFLHSVGEDSATTMVQPHHDDKQTIEGKTYATG